MKKKTFVLFFSILFSSIMYAHTLQIYSGNWNINPDVTKETPNSVIVERDNQRKILAHAVPGDILVKPGHVVIIQNLNYPDDNMLITDYTQVDVIHSVEYLKGESENPQFMVRKGTWENIQNIVNDYQIRRLSITE